MPQLVSRLFSYICPGVAWRSEASHIQWDSSFIRDGLGILGARRVECVGDRMLAGHVALTVDVNTCSSIYHLHLQYSTRRALSYRMKITQRMSRTYVPV